MIVELLDLIAFAFGTMDAKSSELCCVDVRRFEKLTLKIDKRRALRASNFQISLMSVINEFKLRKSQIAIHF